MIEKTWLPFRIGAFLSVNYFAMIVWMMTNCNVHMQESQDLAHGNCCGGPLRNYLLGVTFTPLQPTCSLDSHDFRIGEGCRRQQLDIWKTHETS